MFLAIAENLRFFNLIWTAIKIWKEFAARLVRSVNSNENEVYEEQAKIREQLKWPQKVTTNKSRW